MEPTIKFEICDDLYSGSAMHGGYTQNQLTGKRSFNDCDQDRDASYENTLSFNTPPPQRQLQMPVLTVATAPKRIRRGDGNVLMAEPFFEAQGDYKNRTRGENVTARCFTCNVMIRGHKHVSSNFIKHLKRLHPEVYKIYENYKSNRMLPFIGTPSYNNNSKSDDTFGGDYCDANAFLEQLQPASEKRTNVAVDTNGSSEMPTIDFESNADSSENTTLEQSSALAMTITTENSTMRTMETLIRRIFDEKLKSFVTHEEFQNASINSRVSKSNYPTPAQQPSHAPDVTTQMQQIQHELHVLRQSKREMQREIESIDQSSRRRQMIVRNLHLDTAITQAAATTAVEQLFHDRLGLDQISIQQVTLLGNKNNANKQQQNVLVELKNVADAQLIFRNCFKLKNSGIFIEPELSQCARKRKGKLLVVRRELLRRNTALSVQVRGTKLLVCGRQFYWDDIDGLCVGDGDSCTVSPNTATALLDAANVLHQVTDMDLKEFLYVLKNYDVKVR